MKRIKLECWWTNSGLLTERFLRSFVPKEDLNEYEFVFDNQDYTIVFGRTDFDKISTDKKNTFYLSQEPLWSPNQPKNSLHEYFNKVIISDKSLFEDKEEYVETLLPMFYAGHGNYDYNNDEFDWRYEMKDFEFNKTKPFSIICTSNYHSWSDELQIPEKTKSLYKTRCDLSTKLSQNPNIDVYGYHWEPNGKNIIGEIWNKRIGLNEYKFSLCSENTIQKNYVSEKFWDAVLTETVPVYLGCNNIHDYIPEDLFINLTPYSHDMDLMVQKVNEIVDNHEELYNIYRPKVLELKDMYFNDSRFNLWLKIKELVS